MSGPAAFRAITRSVSPALAQCALTHIGSESIDVAGAEAQHAAYERALASLGCHVVSLPPDPNLPDSVFVEDTALVLDDLAIRHVSFSTCRGGETAAGPEWKP